MNLKAQKSKGKKRLKQWDRKWVLFPFLLCSFCARAEDWDRRLAKSGYVDVGALDTTIRVHLIYATPLNFTGKAVYRGLLSKAWLHPDAAMKLLQAQKILRRQYPRYSLLVYDAARPVSVQQIMWDLVWGTKKEYYISDPFKNFGRHNYGMAVDVTIADETGKSLPMGSPFDFFGEEAHTDKEPALLKAGKISRKEYQNRLLLRHVMCRAGFTAVSSEWWHFNACSGSEAAERYRLIE